MTDWSVKVLNLWHKYGLITRNTCFNRKLFCFNPLILLGFNDIRKSL